MLAINENIRRHIIAAVSAQMGAQIAERQMAGHHLDLLGDTSL
jgi:hypothetical protein